MNLVNRFEPCGLDERLAADYSHFTGGGLRVRG
jgi:hypothetical protein